LGILDSDCTAGRPAHSRSRKRQSPSELIAHMIAVAVSVCRPNTRYAVDLGAEPTTFMRRLLSDQAFDALCAWLPACRVRRLEPA
jgi:hypothetical protein